jgi:hypothetical protein
MIRSQVMHKPRSVTILPPIRTVTGLCKWPQPPGTVQGRP